MESNLTYRISIEKVDAIAEQFGYIRIDHQPNIGMVSYSKDINRINVYLSKMTVCTYIDHPKRGRNQLFRKNVSENMLHKLFQNPRTHTGKGYRKNLTR